MAVLTQKSNVRLTHYNVAVKESAGRVARSGPRPCMVVSVGLILAGLSIPFLMLLGLLPLSFVLAFLGFALTAAGGIMALIFCGEF
jgi:hypothetical protein